MLHTILKLRISPRLYSEPLSRPHNQNTEQSKHNTCKMESPCVCWILGGSFGSRQICVSNHWDPPKELFILVHLIIFSWWFFSPQWSRIWKQSNFNPWWFKSSKCDNCDKTVTMMLTCKHLWWIFSLQINILTVLTQQSALIHFLSQSCN